jgi:predicted nuclease with TOPRIM domain
MEELVLKKNRIVKEISDINNKIESIKNKNRELDETLRITNEEKGNLLLNVDSLEGKNKELTEKLENSETENSEFKNKIEIMENEVIDKNSKIQELEENVNTLKEELKDARNSFEEIFGALQGVNQSVIESQTE